MIPERSLEGEKGRCVCRYGKSDPVVVHENGIVKYVIKRAAERDPDASPVVVGSPVLSGGWDSTRGEGQPQQPFTL